ncbi:hypothetical protein BZA05DRAFT_386117 [Tricharina praecox]|uniref:uncharacterized protein n=1 Tax=Tricharina praecox TaxID=43433 RepID=UPI002220AEA7|nr:uncharacterized protein BZA05DRAFT_386117 [Tricharina praecox]KAI5858146.1 hypothetical protein BZA05DRAFT_386117 [Tricharina praecox]
MQFTLLLSSVLLAIPFAAALPLASPNTITPRAVFRSADGNTVCMANFQATPITPAKFDTLLSTFLDGDGGACCGGYCMELSAPAAEEAVLAAADKLRLCIGQADAGVQTFTGMYTPMFARGLAGNGIVANGLLQWIILSCGWHTDYRVPVFRVLGSGSARFAIMGS